MSSERTKIIKELQKLAEEVFNLKKEHRQKRPIVIEFSGSPKAGKTSCINSLELFLKRNGFSVRIIQERASICPVSDKQSPMFNLWTACMSLAGLIGTLEDKKNQVDVLILDRGIFDALCWFEWLVSNSKMEEEQRYITEKFILMDELVKTIDIVFAFYVEPDISIVREYSNLLTNKPGSIMNKKVLGDYLKAIEATYDNKKQYFHKVFKIDTSKKNQNEVGKEVTKTTLDNLKELLMERIAYFEKNEAINQIICSKNIIDYDELVCVLSEVKFDMREKVESNNNFLQLLPVAIITNLSKDKVLAVKKSKTAVSASSPEKEKILLYVGGHSREEDMTDAMSHDLLSLCRSTLKREVKEEIGISIALNDITPFCIYINNGERSEKHLAVCFLVKVDEEGIKLRLDSQELTLKKGKSKSGHFLSVEELAKEDGLEEWSKLILSHCFEIDFSDNRQISMFD